MSKTTEIEAAVFRRLIEHLDAHKEVQNIDLMILADFCRNCLAKWYQAASEEHGESVDLEAARERIYKMPYSEWKDKHQTPASPEQLAALDARKQKRPDKAPAYITAEIRRQKREQIRMMDKNALYFSMDNDSLINRLAEYPFKLEDNSWPSIEHYYQSKLFANELYQAQIASAPSSLEARKMGTSWWRRRIPQWKEKRSVLMTRAVYTQCRTHPELAERLLATQGQKLVENSQYEHFWGCGRDHRGSNTYGQVLMKVRERLAQELAYSN